MLDKVKKRKLRHIRVRARVFGTTQKPRLNIYRSLKHIYAQLIDDEKGKTLVSSSNTKKKMTPEAVGEAIAKKALELKIKEAVFDKGGFKYHGQVRELAEGARKGGLKF